MAFVPRLDWVDNAPPGFKSDEMKRIQLGLADASTDAAAAQNAADQAAALAQSAIDQAGPVSLWAALPWLPDVSYTAIEDKLSKWRAALATGTAQAVIIGDSISEGTGASVAELRWQTLVQQSLAPNGALFPFVPADPAAPMPFPVTPSGGPGASSATGFGWRTATLVNGQSLTFSFTGTSFEVMYTKTAATGWLNISVDGGAPSAIDTNATRTGGTSDAAVWTSPALTDGAHQVVLSGSSATTEAAYVQGILTYRGDESSGVRVIDAAHHGILSTYLTSARIGTVSKAVVAAGGADLVVIGLGTNDYRDGTTPATYKANIEALISGLRADGFAGSVALVGAYLGSGRDLPGWLLLMDTLRQIADADPDVAFFDWRRRMPDVPSPVTDPSGLTLYADTVHPSDEGHAWLGRVMGDYLALRDVDGGGSSPAEQRGVVYAVKGTGTYSMPSEGSTYGYLGTMAAWTTIGPGTAPPEFSYTDATPTVDGNAFIANVAGVFRISAMIRFAANNTGLRFAVIVKNGTQIKRAGGPAETSGPTDISIDATVRLAAGDRLGVMAIQNSGGALSIDRTTYSPQVVMEYLGA